MNPEKASFSFQKILKRKLKDALLAVKRCPFAKA